MISRKLTLYFLVRLIFHLRLSKKYFKSIRNTIYDLLNGFIFNILLYFLIVHVYEHVHGMYMHLLLGQPRTHNAGWFQSVRQFRYKVITYSNFKSQ